MAVAAVAQPPAARQATTHHQGTFNGQPIRYTATVQETWLTDAAGKAGVSIITTAYVSENTGKPAERPVLFVFNGGPGASSMPLHMSAFGPKRLLRNVQPDSTTLIDNPNSLLDRADLVFVDPPGTGFTRVQDSTVATAYWAVKNDAQAVVDLIKAWRQTNHREASPLYVCGESYGTIRAVQMLELLGDLPLSGVLLLSAILDMGAVSDEPGHDLPYLLNLPTMAAVAWYHKKADRRFTSVEQIYTEATHFAQTDYTTALMQGSQLPASEKKRVASRLSQFIGLPADTLLTHNLRISSPDFQHTLLADKGLRTGQLNGQITGPVVTDPSVHPAYRDPSMFRSQGNRRATERYFTQTLQFADARTYQTVNFGVNGRWNWQRFPGLNAYWTVAPILAETMQARPTLRLFVAGGYYDLATPLYAAHYTLDHIGVPTNRTTLASFPAGHSIFEDESQLAPFTQQVRAFLLPVTR